MAKDWLAVPVAESVNKGSYLEDTRKRDFFCLEVGLLR